MVINTGYEQSFVEEARRELKEIENRGVSKLEKLEDLKDTTGKSFRTSDIEKLMEKYDPEAFAKYKNIAYTAEGGHSSSGLSYLSRWMDKVKAGFAKEESVSKSNDLSKTNENKLSKKAQDFLKTLREKYGDYDFFISNSTDDLKTLAKSGNKEFSVIFSGAELERMANDEKYANEMMQGVEGAVKMCKRICEENGYVSAFGDGTGENGTINKIGISIDDNGNMKFFAELEKNSRKQRERIEKNREKKAEEKKEEEKKAADKEKKLNHYQGKDAFSVKRMTVEADSAEELIDKITNIEWEKQQDRYSGERFSFTV